MAYIGYVPVDVSEASVSTVDNFAAGVGFTAGSSTTVTLSTVPASENSIVVSFDGVTQHHNTYTLAGAIITFDTAIPTGTSNVEVIHYNSIALTAVGDATVTTAKIASGAVTAAKIVDNAVTLAKMASGTDGNIISYDASGNPVAIATGTDGQVLTSAGAGAQPAFEDAGGGGGWTLLTPQASTSGTSIDFTGIPSSATALRVTFDDVSTNGTSPYLIQLGDSGGIETSGYSGYAVTTANAAASAGNGVGNGHVIGNTITASNIQCGLAEFQLSNLSNNQWTSTSVLTEDASTGFSAQGASTKSLTATLDRVRITTSNGSDAFDAGELNVCYQ
jgi:hypothetical protein